MSVHSIASFSNHLATRIPSRPRVVERHSVPRLFAPKTTKTPEPPTTRHPAPPEVQREIDDMLKKGRKNPPPAPDKTPEPEGTNW